MIRGITFRWQEVRPEDDGRLYSAILTDGVIFGCEPSFAGYTLTVAPGYLLACGRLMKIGAAQNYACNGASSGYARLVLKIDLNAEASIESFKQIDAEVQYSQSINDFPALQQQDINDGLSKDYQLPLVVLALEAAGITQIVDKLDAVDFREERS